MNLEPQFETRVVFPYNPGVSRHWLSSNTSTVCLFPKPQKMLLLANSILSSALNHCTLLLVRVLQRNRNNRICIERERDLL